MKRLLSPFLGALLLLLMVTSCKSTANPDQIVKNSFPEFYKEGHRGARGLLPENTIASMKKAIDDGANFIELDVQISKDHQVIVAHDPTINRNITLTPEGEEIPENAEQLVLYQMPYELIRKYDVGSKHNKAFPQQQNMPAYIPLLGELIDSVLQIWPAGAPQPWLPLHGLALRWRGSPQQGRAGDAFTVTIEATADGASATQLPEIELPPIDGAQVFADPPQSDDGFEHGRPRTRVLRRFSIVPSAQIGKVTRIVDAALELFNEHGTAAVSTNRIAEHWWEGRA